MVRLLRFIFEPQAQQIRIGFHGTKPVPVEVEVDVTISDDEDDEHEKDLNMEEADQNDLKLFKERVQECVFS